MRFTQHLDPHSHPYPSAKSLLPPIVKSLPPRHSIFLPSANFPPIRVSPSLSVPQPSPFTPYFTPHPIMPCALTPIPHHPFPSHFFAPQDSFSQVPPSTSLHLSPVRQFPIRVSPSSVFLSQAPPVDFLVRKKARFTHDMTFFHHDVRRKRFSAHEESHKMEMIISKDHVAEKPRRGWGLWRHGRP